jgi:hypothetical protein|tara:strand:+ start:778 stop:1047 length:270 start_codon:yes stop_codon:yes gene_type:complete
MPVGTNERIKKSGKVRNKVMKPITLTYGDPDPLLQYKVPKGVEDDKKIRPKDIFEGYVDKKSKPKGVERKKSKRKMANLNTRIRGSNAK